MESVKELPIFRTVMDDNMGNPIVFNICMLGTVVALTNIVRLHSFIEVIGARVPEEALKINRLAVDLGLELGEAPTSPASDPKVPQAVKSGRIPGLCRLLI